MLSTKTVFVLGAGASEPYGFPLGFKLYQDVLSEFSRSSPSRGHLFNCTAFSERNLSPFIKALEQSGLSSVDLFIENRKEFLEIGKACMAILLIQKEVDSALWVDAKNWMKYLWQRLQPFDRLNENPISFITYNYDRSLEHFLVTSLQNTLGLSIEEAAKVILKIPIIHLHGRLGYLPWQNEHGREYRADVNPHTVELCVRHIHVYHEEPDAKRDEEFAEARRLLIEAPNTYFLGFGFGAKNVQRLKIKEMTHDSLATAVGLRTKEIAEVVTMCGHRIHCYNDVDCIEFLRERVNLQ